MDSTRPYNKGKNSITPTHKVYQLTSPSDTTIYTQAVEMEESSGESDVSLNRDKIDSVCLSDMSEDNDNNLLRSNTFVDRDVTDDRGKRSFRILTPPPRRDKYALQPFSSQWRDRDDKESGRRAEEQRKRREDELILEAERSKARISKPPGKPDFSDKARELSDKYQRQEFRYTCDDEFFYLSSQVDKSIKEKNKKR